MILTGVILGASLVGLGVFFAKFWHPIHEWVKKAIESVQSSIKNTVLGIFLLVRRTADGAYKKISRNISKNGEKYVQTDVVSNKPISASEVPKEILAKAEAANRNDTDITENYRKVLKNTA